MATFEVHKVESERALHAAYLVMRELRPHLTDARATGSGGLPDL